MMVGVRDLLCCCAASLRSAHSRIWPALSYEIDVECCERSAVQISRWQDGTGVADIQRTRSAVVSSCSHGCSVFACRVGQASRCKWSGSGTPRRENE